MSTAAVRNGLIEQVARSYEIPAKSIQDEMKDPKSLRRRMWDNAMLLIELRMFVDQLLAKQAQRDQELSQFETVAAIARDRLKHRGRYAEELSPTELQQQQALLKYDDLKLEIATIKQELKAVRDQINTVEKEQEDLIKGYRAERNVIDNQYKQNVNQAFKGKGIPLQEQQLTTVTDQAEDVIASQNQAKVRSKQNIQQLKASKQIADENDVLLDPLQEMQMLLRFLGLLNMAATPSNQKAMSGILPLMMKFVFDRRAQIDKEDERYNSGYDTLSQKLSTLNKKSQMMGDQLAAKLQQLDALAAILNPSQGYNLGL